MEVREVLSNAFGVVRVRVADADGFTKESIVEQARVAAANAAKAPVEFLYSVHGPGEAVEDVLFGGPRP